MSEFARRRTIMVDTQVRPSDVTKFPIIDAMLTIPREAFVPAALKEAAYAGENLGVARGRTLLDPRTFAKILEAVNIQPTDLVLDVACGMGYSSAIAAHMAEAVIALDDNADLCAEAENALSYIGADNVAVVEGPLEAGAAQHGPYDVILIQGGVETIPEALTDQLKDGGRIAAIFEDGRLGTVRVGLKSDGVMSWRYAFNADAPVLKSFRKSAEFAL